MQGKLDDAEQCGIAARDELLALGDTHAAKVGEFEILWPAELRTFDFRTAVTHFESAITGFAMPMIVSARYKSSIGLADALAATGGIRRSTAPLRQCLATKPVLVGGRCCLHCARSQQRHSTGARRVRGSTGWA